MADIYRTVFQVEVFSEGPFAEGGHPMNDPFGLKDIDYAITDGDCIGNVDLVSSEVVPPEKVHEELLRIGNDGTFFGEDD